MTRKEQIAVLTRDGMTPEEIAGRIGINRATVYRHLHDAREKGLLPKSMRHGAGASLWASIQKRLTQQERDWLAAQVPPGSCIADVLACIVRDAAAGD